MSEFVMPSYKVFLDTNTLYSRKPEEVISKAAVKILGKCEEITKVNFFVPSVVPSELAYQQFRTAVAATENLVKNQSTITSAIGIKLPVAPSSEDCFVQAKKIVLETMAAAKIQIFEIPVETIKWDEVIEDACWRKSTFEPPPDEQPTWEKGFRDRVVLEASLVGLRELSSACRMIFISGDNKLREAFTERCTREDLSVEIFEKPSDFLSHIELLDASRSESFVAHIINVIPSHFYSEDNVDSVFNRFNLKEVIIKEFGDDAKQPNYFAYLKNKTGATSAALATALGVFNVGNSRSAGWKGDSGLGGWRQASGLRIRIGTTEFQTNPDPTFYYWLTRIELACMLQRASLKLTPESYWMRVININVHWKCRIDNEGNITDSTLESVEKDIVSPFIEVDWETRMKFEIPSFPIFLLPEEEQSRAKEDRVVGEKENRSDNPEADIDP